MSDTNLLEKFILLIEQSGLPESRKEYWFSRIEQGTFDEQALEELNREMKAHFAELELAARVKEAQIEDQQEEKAVMEAKLLPLVDAYAKAQPALLAEEEKTMKGEYSAVYDEMLQELQVASTSQKEQDIEAIRKFLAQGKPANDNAGDEGQQAA